MPSTNASQSHAALPLDPERRVQFTKGAGLNRPKGSLVTVEVDPLGPVRAVRDAIAGMPPESEAWIAAGIFEGNHRSKKKWIGCDLLAVDVDYQDSTGSHSAVPPEIAVEVEGLMRDGRIDGSLAHLTPRGFRVVFVLSSRLTDGQKALAALKGAGHEIDAQLAECGLGIQDDGSGFAVDGGTLELARLVFTPSAIVEGVQRKGELFLLRNEAYRADHLAAVAPPAKPDRAGARPGSRPVPQPSAGASGRATSFGEAAHRWNSDHSLADLPVNGGACPMCLHQSCFGELPNRAGRWACFSANHQRDAARLSPVGDGCGREMQDHAGSGCGDALDIAAWERGCSPREVLRADGYLENPASVFGSGADGQVSAISIPVRPRITVMAGELRPAIMRAEDALLRATHLNPIFQRGDQLVRIIEMDDRTVLRKGVELPAHMPVLERLQPVYLRALLEQAAEFWKIDKRGDSHRCPCPTEVVTGYQQSAGLWRIPRLRSVVQTPILRPDGAVLQTPGYDECSQLFYDPAGVVFPEIPDEPSIDDARSAVQTLLEPVEHFAFVDPWDQAVWLAALLTPFVRPSLSSAPMFVFDAPVRGSGKGKLVNIIATIAAGTWPAIMSHVDDDNEQRKRILALLMQGTPIINVDNVEAPMGGAALCTVLTEAVFEDRILGESKTARVPTTTTWLATGNNIVIVGDLTRRVLMCRIDPRVERPEDLRFPFEPVALAQKHRARYVVAALTLLRAFVVAGRPQGDLTPFGSFETWSEMIRAALVWVGQADPVLGRRAVQAADSELDRLRAFISCWFDLFADKPMTIRAALQEAGALGGESSNALLAMVEEMTEERDPHRRCRLLGRKIAATQGRVVDGLQFVDGGLSRGTKRWQVQCVTASES